MLSNNLQGSLINASKPVKVLNRLTSNKAMLAWYQDNPVGVLNGPARNEAISGQKRFGSCTNRHMILKNNNIYQTTSI